jgi:hypothetical protein
MFHAQCSSERRIRFHHNTVLLAKRGDVCSRIKRMDFYLIHCRDYPGLRGQQFLQMLEPIVADSAYPSPPHWRWRPPRLSSLLVGYSCIRMDCEAETGRSNLDRWSQRTV